MMSKLQKLIVLVIILAGVATVILMWMGKYNLSRLSVEQSRIAQEVQQKIVLDDLEPQISEEETRPNNQEDAPAKYLLAMPFYSQAPNGNWDAIHEEMCEEASLLNAGLFLENKKLSSSEYEKELLKLKNLGEKVVGTWVSTSISDTKKLSDAYFVEKIKSKIIDNPTIDQIQSEIASGHPVIVPLAGRDIGNPNYTPPGPIYHMLVVKGYDGKFFITNDVGTRKGDSYVYRKNVIMDNMYDWDEKDIHLGKKRVLVLMKNS